MRVIIILMAAGLVLIGIFPFRRDLRSGFEHARAASKTCEMRSVLPESSSEAGPAAESRRPQAPRRGGLQGQRRSLRPRPLCQRGCQKAKVDHLSEDDRASLDELLNR